MKDVLDRLRGYNLGAKGHNVDDNRDPNDVPIDGNLYATSEYLRMLSGNNKEFYLRYLDHLKYFTNLFRFEGSDEVKRWSPHIFRQLVEFGKVAITKIKGKIIVLAVVELEYDMYQNVSRVTGMALRTGIGYTKEYAVIELDPAKTVVIRQNYQGFPFIITWKSVIEKIIHLSKAAETGSIASIKKFHRRLSNNDSMISQEETKSMLDPKTPYVNTIVSPLGYKGYMDFKRKGDAASKDKPMLTSANSLEFTSLGSSASDQWDNLQAYMEFEYYQKNRRINTNKKNERNISKEIDTETVNFDILDMDMYKWLDIAVRELKDKLSIDVEIIAVVEEKEEVSNDTVQNTDKRL